MKISLIHPFTAKAIGFDDEIYLYKSHSIPQAKALKEIQEKEKFWSVKIEYFTTKLKNYSYCHEGLIKKFWISTNFKHRYKWNKEESIFQYLFYYFFPPDITIINMSGNGSNYILKLSNLLRRKGKKYISMIGGINISKSSNMIDYYKNAECILVHTEKQKQDLEFLDSFKKMNIKVLPLGVDTKIFKSNLNKNYENLKALFVGRVNRLKQIEKAITALNFCKEKGLFITLDIIGPISNKKYYKELIQLIKQKGLVGEVVFKGNLNQQDLVKYYNEASVLLLPSQHESFGMVITEAMACNVPTVALEGSIGPEEIIVNGHDGFIAKSNYFSETVYQLLSNQDLYRLISSNCSRSVEQKWSQEITTKLLYQVIKEVKV